MSLSDGVVVFERSRLAITLERYVVSCIALQGTRVAAYVAGATQGADDAVMSLSVKSLLDGGVIVSMIAEGPSR